MLEPKLIKRLIPGLPGTKCHPTFLLNSTKCHLKLSQKSKKINFEQPIGLHDRDGDDDRDDSDLSDSNDAYDGERKAGGADERTEGRTCSWTDGKL